MLGPRLEAVIGGMEGKVSLAKVDIDNNSEIAIDYGVCMIMGQQTLQNILHT